MTYVVEIFANFGILHAKYLVLPRLSTHVEMEL